MSTRVITGKCRASFAKLMAPVRNELNGKEEYSVMLLIPKDDTATVKAIKEACKAAIASKWPTNVPKNLRNPLRNGDEETRSDGSPMGPEYKGHFFMNTKCDVTKHIPEIVDKAGRKLIDHDAIVSGDYIRVSMNAYPYDANGNRGVAFGLNNVQLVEKGEPLGSNKVSAAQEFGIDTSSAKETVEADSDWS